MERKFAFEKVDSLFMSESNSVWESEIGKYRYPVPILRMHRIPVPTLPDIRPI
jgi:hypothetical protein